MGLLNTQRREDTVVNGVVEEQDFRRFNKDRISFCQFDDEVLDVATVDELWDSTYKGIKLSDMLSSIPEDDVYVY